MSAEEASVGAPAAELSKASLHAAQQDAEDDPEVKREQFAFWIAGFPAGMTFMALLLWSSGFLLAASSDETCARFDGHSSGADGELCTALADWDETRWVELGGLACLVDGDGFLVRPQIADGTISPFRAAPQRRLLASHSVCTPRAGRGALHPQ